MKTGTEAARLSLGVIALCALVLAGACSGEEKEAAPEEAAGLDVPELGVLELPVSLRTSDPQPSDARSVEVTPAGIRVDGKPLMLLEGGKLPAAERKDGLIPKLKEALASPSKSELALALHSSVPYDTVAAVLDTAKAGGMRSVGFKVRKPSGTDAGWLVAKSFVMTPRTHSATDVSIPGVDPHKWDEFANAWQAVYDACRGAQTGSCAYVQSNVAKGGNLKIVLHAAGQGAAINFFRSGVEGEELSEEEAKRKAEIAQKQEDFIQGRISKTEIEKELLEGPPATEALFQFRAREAQVSPSPVSETLKPLCGSKACGAIVSSDPTTLAVRMVGLLGAAFPDGAAPPHLAFEQPWTEKPKLSTDEIMKQQAADELEGKLQRAAEAAEPEAE
jgi:biopolymer transport protein ExbD